MHYLVIFNIWMAVVLLMLFIGVEGKVSVLLCALFLAGYNIYLYTKEGLRTNE